MMIVRNLPQRIVCLLAWMLVSGGLTPQGLAADDRSPPQILFQPTPLYPPAMKQNALVGTVLIQFEVDKNGDVQNPVVLKSDNPGFNDAAIDVILKSKFAPGRIGDRPTRTRITQSIEFGLEPVGRPFISIPQLTKEQQNQNPAEFQYDIAPKPENFLVPIYPYAHRRDKIGGKATVTFIVESDGRVSDVKVIEASQPEFGLALAAAIEGGSFIPAQMHGKPTKAFLKREQKFTLGSPIDGGDDELLSWEQHHPEKILSPKKLDAPLKLLSQRRPKFPSSVQDRLDEGEATVEILVDGQGKVHLPRVVAATDPAFGYAAMQAMIDWRFAPPKSGGKEAAVRVQAPLEFRLKRPSTKAVEFPMTEGT